MIRRLVIRCARCGAVIFDREVAYLGADEVWRRVSDAMTLNAFTCPSCGARLTLRVSRARLVKLEH